MPQTPAKHVHRDVTLGALLVVLLSSAFLVVLPQLQALKAMPEHYYNLLPVANETGDIDRDGLPDNLDARPFGQRDYGVGKRVGESAKLNKPMPTPEIVADEEATEEGHAAAEEGEAMMMEDAE